MKTFAEHYCLKENRDNFFIDESRDAQLVLGNQKYRKTIDEMLDAAVASRRPPRLVWVGDFGVGKTHHINYTYDKIQSGDLPFKVIKLQMPDLIDSSNFNVLFESMVSRVEKSYVQTLLEEQLKDKKWYEAISVPDVKKAFRQMSMGDELGETAWSYLCGRKLTKEEKAAVGVSKLQLDDSEEFACVLHSLCQIIKQQTPEKRVLMYLIDEVEGLGVVKKANAFNSWVLALRKVLDIKEIGLILAVGAQNIVEIPGHLQDGAIIRRFGNQNYVLLEQYDITDTKRFLSGLFKEFVDPEKRTALETAEKLKSKPNYDSDCYPFLSDAFEDYCGYLVGENARAKPAEFQTALHATLTAAQKEGKAVVDRAFISSRGETN